MSLHDRTNDPGPVRAARVPLWALVAAFLAGLALLEMLGPAEARAQSADSSVVLEWTAPGDDGSIGRAAQYDIRYRTSTITGSDTLSWWNAATQVAGEPLPGVSGASDSMRVRGLTPLTTYYFMIRAADEVPNWSGFSNVAVKSTGGDAVAPAAIADLSVTGTTGSSITVRWTAPGDDGTTGTASSYDLRYSTSAITNANWSSATTVTGEPAPSVGGTTQTFVVAGLTGSRTYYVAIKTTDDHGNVSLISNVVNATTADTLPPGPVRDLSYDEDADAAGRETLALLLVAPSERDAR
jgi:hypothetical protein